MPEIISREEAKARGLKRYFTGEPCKYGHLSERSVASAYCIECFKIYEALPENKLKKSRRKKLWDMKNKEKNAVVNKKRYEKNKETIRAKYRQWYEKTREARLAYNRKYYEEVYKRCPEYRKSNLIKARKRKEKIADLLAVLRNEMPDLLKEFDL